MEFDKQWWEEFRRNEVDEILSFTAKKNSDYTGGQDNDNPFANFDESSEFGVEPITGLCVRMADKFHRAKAYCRDGKLSVSTKGDQTADIFRDLIGYSLVALGMLERQSRERQP